MSGVELAVLHGEAEVARGECSSDVDVVTRHSAHDVVRRAHGALRARGLHPVVVWPYDVGSASVFVVDATAGDGAQIDVLHDRSGRGHYGVRADAVIARARPGARWLRASDEDELLYLVRKRLYKGQTDRLAALLATTTAMEGLRDRALDLFSPPSARAVTAALDGRRQPADPLRRPREALANAGRVASRLRRPVGFWVAVDGPAARPTAERIATRFARVLPAAGSGATSGTVRGVRNDVARIARVRWRAGVYASWGPRPVATRPDLTVSSADATGNDVLRDVVVAMERRLER